MKSLSIVAGLISVWFAATLFWPNAAIGLQAPPVEYAALKAQAEKLYADHSYAKANELYRRAAAAKLELDEAETRWLEFRLADTSWRSQAATQTADSTIYDRAREKLEALINQIKREEDRDLVWAEAQESLGDFWWARRDSQNWGAGWNHYQAALSWWANSDELDTARKRYLDIVWAMSEPAWMERSYWNHYSNVPIEVLDNALKIAVDQTDKAHASYLIALTLRHYGDARSQRRVPKAFEAALAPGESTDWYDDALYGYGEWLMNAGIMVLNEHGQWMRKPDLVKALDMFRRLVTEFDKGQTRYWDNAQNYIKQITGPSLSVGVSNIFLPGSEIQYHLNWRNVGQIDLALYQVDLTRDMELSGSSPNDWLNRIDLGGAQKIKSWTKDAQDKGDYMPGQSTERLDEPLKRGAYIIEAAAGGEGGRSLKVRDIIFVTDAAVILKTAGPQALAYVCDAVNGSPVAGATVRMWKLTHRDNRWIIDDATKEATEQGLAVFGPEDFPGNKELSAQYIAAAIKDDRQAIAAGQGNWHSRDGEQWRIYAFTDRPAYRPGETVEWKLIARTWNVRSEGFRTPADQTLEYQINDPRGSKVAEGSADLNAFGSAWGSVELTASMPLGEYRVDYWSDKARHHHVGSATLFRLEEYKLPEFKVAITTPEENGRKKAFVLGDYVEANIQADYYFGGPVANASVEVVVTQSPHYHWWHPPREFPWCYEDPNPYRYWGGYGGQIIKRETIKTDQTGRAVLTFETPADAQQDFEYRIEARVIDASRREITAADSVRVTRQRYYVHAHPKHQLHQPGDEVEIDFKAIDANQQPIEVEGAVKVTREWWTEIWIDPTGQEVSGAALRAIQERERHFPPPLHDPDARGWRLKFRGYETEDILTTKIKTDAKGEATLAFVPQAEGYYRIHWSSKDPWSAPEDNALPITTETAVWIATSKTTELGYRHGALQLIVDKDTFRVGNTAPVMISVPTNDRYVLFSVEGNDLYTVQLVHVTGTVKLIQVPIEPKHVPNIYLSAAMAHDGQLHQDRKEVVVPPVEQYLKVEVAADRESAQYQPGEEGVFTVLTTDHDGKPVSAEVALAVVDESVTYIQQDYAGDPRPHFFEQRQNLIVQTGSTFQQKAYIKLVEGENKQLMDERLRALREEESRDGFSKNERGRFAGGGGGGFDDASYGFRAMKSAAYPPSAAPMAAAEAGLTGNMALADQLGMSRMDADEKDLQGFRQAGQAPADGPDGQPAVVVRSDFRSTLLWQPSIITDEDGTAKVTLKYGDSLTSWSATARAAGKGNQFGMGATTTRTKMPLIARLQAPRFFLVGDTVTVSGVINNNTDEIQTVLPELFARGLTINGMLRPPDGQPVKSGSAGGAAIIDIPANGEARVDWQVSVESPGEALLKLTATGDKYADGMEKTYTIYEHGVERFLAKSGKVRGNDITVKLDIPTARKPESTTLMVQVSPSMAVTMLDALPYLIDYPYGCTEQTMSRFLPAAITAKTLRDLGVEPNVVMGKLFGGIEQEHVDKTQRKPKGDLTKLDQITQASLDRLYDFQHSDGGWGWWKEGDSDHFMTAYVLWGLCLAKDADLDVRQDVLDRARNYLDLELVEEEEAHDQQAWMLHALAAYHATMRLDPPSDAQVKAFNNLWTDRDRLNAYTRALVALAAHHFGEAQKAQTLVDNLENGVKRDERPDTSVIVKGSNAGGAGGNDAVMGTAHWGEDGLWWRWSEGGVEATAFALRAIIAIDPKNKLVEPVTNWLVKNRGGAQWSNTRDTAIVVLTLNDYLRASGELSPELEYELLVNGKSIASRKLSAADALSAPSRYEIDRALIRDGTNDIRIVRRNGDGPIYFAAESTFFSLEEPVPASGSEIFVRRDYYKLVPKPTLLKGYVYERVPLADGGAVASGERVEVVMTVEAKNNYEYLVFEDLKPAGLEAVAVRSGEPVYARQMKQAGIERTFGDGDKDEALIMDEQAHSGDEDYTGQQRWVYQELRDRKVALFIDRLTEGIWEVRYDLRAETPGRFHALPVMGHAMYVPEIRANSAEVRLSVIE